VFGLLYLAAIVIFQQ